MASDVDSPVRPNRALAPAAWACCLAWACAPAAAQDTASRPLFFEPSFQTQITHARGRRGDAETTSDWVTQLSPGLRLNSRSGRLRGSLSYTLDAIAHTDPRSSELQNALNAAFTAELVETWAYVDANARISQRSLSAFGEQSVDDGQQANANRVEVGTVSVSPYVRGAFGSLAGYEVRLNAAATNARRSKAGDSSTTGATVALNSAKGASIFGWGLQANRQRSSYRLGRATESERASVSLSARPDAELLLTVRAGRERTDTADVQGRGYNTVGGSLTWTPNERTLASLDTERRYFGQSRRISLEHRLPLSAFRFTSTRDASSSSDPFGVGQPQTLYQLTNAQLLSQFPDPVARDLAVRDRLALLGLDPESIVGGGFLNASTTLQRRDDIGWTYSARRLTIGLQAFSSETTFIDATALQPADGGIRQRGYTLSAGYKLTPTSSSNLTASRLMTRPTPTRSGTDLKSLSMAWNDQISRLASAALSARYSVFNSVTDPYREAAVTASLSLRF